MLKIQKNIPLPNRKSKQIVEAILLMEDGDSIFISYDDFNKTEITNSLASGRIRILSKGLKIKAARVTNGTIIWAYKPNELTFKP